MTRLQQAALLVLLCCSLSHAQFEYTNLTNPNSLQSGDGTFYGAGQDDQGTCSYSANFANTNGLPWSTGTSLTLALNNNQFANSLACGLCIKYRGTGAGLGTTPIPSSWTTGFVNNRCPECKNGDLDQAVNGDGRWNVQWYAVPCEVGSSALVYSVVVSSYYWFSLVVSNTRIPISGVSVKIGGGWLPLTRTNNNQWAYYNTNGPWQSAIPMGIQVTSCLGETVTDTITSLTGNSGTVQFSESGTGGGTAATSATAATPPAAGTPPATLPSAGTPPPPAAVTPPPASAPPPPAAKSPPPAATSPPPAAAPPTAPPPAAATPPPPAANPPVTSGTAFLVQSYQQCGGSGGSCDAVSGSGAPCVDAKWANAACDASNFACTRYDATMWTCLPNATASPPPPVYTAQPPSAAASPPSSAGSPPPASGSQPPPAASQQPPPASGLSPPPAASQPPPAASQPPPAASQPPPSAATPPPPTSSGTSSSTYQAPIASGGQCGGTIQCNPPGTGPSTLPTCTNGPWANYYCSQPSDTCQANPGPTIWTCMSSQVATGGRKFLSS